MWGSVLIASASVWVWINITLCPSTSTALSLTFAHAGIYVDDIIEAVPIDKYFELFKPNQQGGGGFIRICMNFVKDKAELQQPVGGGWPKF